MNILQKAQEVTHGDRQEDYGDPVVNHQRIAELQAGLARAIKMGDLHLNWETITALDMIMVKIARLIETPDHFDSWADIAGYAWVGSKCAGVKDETE